jgi:hypothetical protein
MNKIIKITFNMVIVIIIMLTSGCITGDKGGNNKKVELSIENITNETVEVIITINKNNELLYNDTISIGSNEKKLINEFDQGFGIYHIYMFIDKHRIFNKDIGITKTQYPPEFKITFDKINFIQKEV